MYRDEGSRLSETALCADNSLNMKLEDPSVCNIEKINMQRVDIVNDPNKLL